MINQFIQFIHWLNVPEISSHILHVRHAHLKHGGKGAFIWSKKIM